MTSISLSLSLSLSTDEDEEIVNLKPILQHSRASWCESADVVGDLPHNNTHKKHPFSQHSDADSAIGMVRGNIYIDG